MECKNAMPISSCARTEFGWKYEIFRQGDYPRVFDAGELWDDIDENAAKDYAANVAAQYALQRGETISFQVWGICRKKEANTWT